MVSMADIIYLKVLFFNKSSIPFFKSINGSATSCKEKITWFYQSTFGPYGKYSKICNTILVVCEKGPDKQCRPRSDCFWRSSLIRFFSVCYSDKHFVKISPGNQQFIWNQKEKGFPNFRTFTAVCRTSQYLKMSMHQALISFPSPPFITNTICFLICLFTLVTYIEDPDQTAPIVVFAYNGSIPTYDSPSRMPWELTIILCQTTVHYTDMGLVRCQQFRVHWK